MVTRSDRESHAEHTLQHDGTQELPEQQAKMDLRAMNLHDHGASESMPLHAARPMWLPAQRMRECHDGADACDTLLLLQACTAYWVTLGLYL